MPIDIPEPQKIHTTIYDNFKGVDFTSDPTNVWRKRSPDAVNMLPDASGRPFKRFGWERVVTATELATILSDALETEVEILEINKCFYFELAGQDHIIIFTNGGVFRYVGGSVDFLEGSDDPDCYGSWDRTFFFEGDGKSAFYVYGNYKVWEYGADLVFKACEYSLEMGKGVYIPTVLITTDASSCTGETHEGYNLIGGRAKVEYTNNDMFYAFTTNDFGVVADKDTFVSKVSSTRGQYEFKFDGTNWKLNGTNVTLSQYGISIVRGNAVENDKIVVVYIYGVLLPNNVATRQYADVRVFNSKVFQFDNELEVTTSTSPSAGICVLHNDSMSYPEADRKAWIEFHSSDANVTPLVQGEDMVRVAFPVMEVSVTNFVDEPSDGIANLVR